MSLMLSLQLQQRRLRVRLCRLYLYSKYVTSFKYNPMNKARDWTAPLSVAIFFSLPFFVPLCPCHTHTQHGGLFRQQLTPHASVYDSSRAAAQNHLFVSMKNASFLTFFSPLRQKTRALASVIATDLNLVVWFMFSLRGLCDNSFLQTWGCCCDKETNEISRTCYEVVRSEFAKNAICGSWSYFRNTSSCSRL